MAITEKDKQAIAEAVEKLHYVHTGPSGEHYIEIYADCRDNNEGLLEPAYENRRLGFEDKEDPQNALSLLLKDKIWDWYADSTWEDECKILREAGFDQGDDKFDELMEYLRDTYPFVPDYDHYLKEETPINLMLGCGDECNRDFVAIYEQKEAILDEDLSAEDRAAALAEENGLSWLVKQQGHTMEELAQIYPAYLDFFNSDETVGMQYNEKYEKFRSTHSPFITSICQELANMVNYMNTLTVLTKLSLEDLAEFMQPGREVVIPKNAMVGIFNPWNGGGSTLDIELEKDLVIPSDKLFDIQIEGVKPDHGYSVDSVYGLVGNAWKSAAAVRDAGAGNPPPVPSLSSLIASAEKRAAEGAQSPDKGRDMTR